MFLKYSYVKIRKSHPEDEAHSLPVKLITRDTFSFRPKRFIGLVHPINGSMLYPPRAGTFSSSSFSSSLGVWHYDCGEVTVYENQGGRFTGVVVYISTSEYTKAFIWSDRNCYGSNPNCYIRKGWNLWTNDFGDRTQVKIEPFVKPTWRPVYSLRANAPTVSFEIFE